MSGGGSRGKGETNEEATWRLIAKGKGGGKTGTREGGGRKGGRGGPWHSGPPPSVDDISVERRDALRAQVQAFSEGWDSQLAMPPSLTGLERKFVHGLAEELGVTTQSFGVGPDRHICLFRAPAGGGNSPGETDGVVVEAGGVCGRDAPDADLARRATYSCVVLSADSQKRLREFCEQEIPAGWTVHCEHMTICMGSLAQPHTEDNRSVAELIRKQTAAMRVGQQVALRVVSMGRARDVVAVGVVGCPCCNRNPHITVAVASGVQPSLSNRIQRWDILPADRQIGLQGELSQRGVPAPWAPAPSEQAAPDLDVAALALSQAISNACARLRGMQGGRPESTEALCDNLICSGVVPEGLFVVHPLRLAEELGASLPDASEVLRFLQDGLGEPEPDPARLFDARSAPVPADVLERVTRDLNHLVGECQCVGASALALWLVSQAYCRPKVEAETLVEGLAKSGILSIQEDGAVSYCVLEESVVGVEPTAAYVRPWPLQTCAQ